ncbi:class I SAM-dependent methyltransferase [Terrimonas sp. NA20]|uniref:Class I SAM-dependent methyltransferase n=1 Tax=Terrimonas ginsenosidimutans TaxID=2908004 RepID=A0ABS9KLS2_9BACT|nr:class I SAM-dependent methyltransferase [Terrimonas ginsenosidimutans]MCG2613272.1 class I SAM-dependent methyltransferase [Terrimonas ginsenosidimutans]
MNFSTMFDDMKATTSSNAAVSRFSNRAENYARFRPGYPSDIFPFLQSELGLTGKTQIVDIGSGTGLFAEPLLQHGFSVTGIEPNDDMRNVAEARLKKYPSFKSINATAEETGLTGNSIDLITIAQTFHWLDPVATRHECQRILAPGGQVVLAWNRQKGDSAFEQQYNALREKYGIAERSSVQVDPVLIADFFSPNTSLSKIFPNKQLLDFEGLKGQLLSKSYIPLPGHESYDAMITDLIRLFVNYNENGLVGIEYETLVIWGTL